MKIFITGTGTNVGKTFVSAFLCKKLQFSYWKPIQTGLLSDSEFLRARGIRTFPEAYHFKAPLSPHLASELENRKINLDSIKIPYCDNLIIEGAGGLLVPLNSKDYMIDFVKSLNIPVILVSSPLLGTINHTLLSLRLLKKYKIQVLGVVLSGELNFQNQESIRQFGKVSVFSLTDVDSTFFPIQS